MGTPWHQLLQPFRFSTPSGQVTDLSTNDQHGRRGGSTSTTAKTCPAGAVLFQIHGGGWTIGDKREQGLPLMLHLAARGWVCVAPN